MPTETIRLLLVGDVHGDLRSLAAVLQDAIGKRARYSAIVCTGDFGPDWGLPGNEPGPVGQALYEGSVAAVLRLLQTLRIPLLTVAGNHDYPEALCAGGWPLLGLDSPQSRLSGWTVAGVGGSPRTGACWPHEWEDDATLRFGPAHRGAMILLSHCPPNGTACDQVLGGQHVGSLRVRDLVLESAPRLVLCGHVHESFGSDELGAAVVVNAGAISLHLPFDSPCGPVRLPAVLYSVVTLHADLSVDVEVRVVTAVGRAVYSQSSHRHEPRGNRWPVARRPVT